MFHDVVGLCIIILRIAPLPPCCSLSSCYVVRLTHKDSRAKIFQANLNHWQKVKLISRLGHPQCVYKMRTLPSTLLYPLGPPSRSMLTTRLTCSAFIYAVDATRTRKKRELPINNITSLILFLITIFNTWNLPTTVIRGICCVLFFFILLLPSPAVINTSRRAIWGNERCIKDAKADAFRAFFSFRLSLSHIAPLFNLI